MGFIGYLIVGGLIGWIGGMIAGKDIPGGVIGNIIAGIIGSFVGGYLPFMQWGPNWAGFRIVPAIIGTIIVVAIVSFIMRSMRRTA